MKLKLLVAVALLSPLPACSERGNAAVPRGARGAVVDSSGGTVALGIASERSYRPGSTASGGSIVGEIVLQGAPRDSVVAVPPKDARVCGDSATVSEASSNGSSLANVLVWVDSISAGKPLPDVRRETLTIEHCRFEPRVMAVIAKSTINVFSRDRTTHAARFYREGAGEPIESIRTVDAGQVVPSEKIASEPGIVEVRCDEHPFARAYIAVFDHPYFAVTDADGAFKIEGLPAGTYSVKVWHERLAKPIEQRVVVGPGGSAHLNATLALK
jgi:hypothetical protein